MDVLTKAVLACSICHQPLTEPKMLPCADMFCKVCLQSHCLQTATNDSFLCPKCSMIVQVPVPSAPLLEWADSFPTKYQIVEQAPQASTSVDGKTNVKCMVCLQKSKGVLATKYCKSCHEYFCDECGNQHWLLRSSKEHRMWLITDLADLQRDPLVRAKLEFVFSAKHRARSKRRGSVLDKHSTDAKSKLSKAVSTEEEDCDITGACFIDGKIVLADKGNMRVSVYDANYSMQAVYRTPCYDVIEINEYFIVISCPEDHFLKILSVYDNVIEEDRKIKVGAECYGLCRIGADFAVALAGKPICVNVYSGSVLKEHIKLEHGKLPFRKPRYLTYHEKADRFYISDNMTGVLKAANRNGTIAWEKKVELCNALTVLGPYLLVASSEKNTVDLLNPDGQILKSVVTPDDGLTKVRVLAIDNRGADEDGQKMIVVDCAEFVHLFVLSDPMADSDLSPHLRKYKRSKSITHEDRGDLKGLGRSKSCVVL